MNSSISTIRHEDLAEHEAWLRALARSLVGEGEADDAVQETYVAALRSPPPADRPLRPWLARVLRNAVRMRWRAEGRRARREEAAAPPSAPLSADALLDRARARELLARLVLELDEPIRHALLLRYGEGLSAAEIARSTGDPAGTVRWRLSRGLAALRERLDAESRGDRRAWRLALAPLCVPREGAAAVASSGAATGALVVNTKLTLAAVGAAALAASLIYPAVSADPQAVDATPPAADGAALAETAAPAPPPPAAAAAPPAREEQDDLSEARRARRRQHAELLARIEAARVRSQRRAPAASAPPSEPDEAPSLDEPALRREYITDAVHELEPLIRECYDLALARDPNTAGVAKVTFTIVGEEEVGGLVTESELDESGTITDPAFRECIRETMYALELEAPPSDIHALTVTYPFTFRPGDDDEP